MKTIMMMIMIKLNTMSITTTIVATMIMIRNGYDTKPGTEALALKSY